MAEHGGVERGGNAEVMPISARQSETFQQESPEARRQQRGAEKWRYDGTCQLLDIAFKGTPPFMYQISVKERFSGMFTRGSSVFVGGVWRGHFGYHEPGNIVRRTAKEVQKSGSACN
jgi:hypothetical protein